MINEDDFTVANWDRWYTLKVTEHGTENLPKGETITLPDPQHR